MKRNFFLRKFDRLLGRTNTATTQAYEQRIARETAVFANQLTVHDLPPIFHYWSNRYLRPMIETFGFSNPDDFFVQFLEHASLAVRPHVARFVSLGSGNCDLEVRLACALEQRGNTNFVIDCVDINKTMLERGRALARERGVEGKVLPQQGDFNAWKPTQQYDAVIANQSLHHVLKLEQLFDAIHAALGPGGTFLASDMIGRNGHLRWPEALDVVREFWHELPDSYRRNLQLNRHEDVFQDWDCSGASFEGIRAQDILPLLIERFSFQLFVGFGNVIYPFIDRSFGHHFKAEADWDRSFIDRVHARDEAEILAGHIKPTQMYAVMQTKAVAETAIWQHLTPQFCVRHSR
jgi:SAM-dependent methyltransferase